MTQKYLKNLNTKKSFMALMAAATVTACSFSKTRPAECITGYDFPESYALTFEEDRDLIYRAALNSKDNTEDTVSNEIYTTLKAKLENNISEGLPINDACVEGDLKVLVLSTGGAWGAFGSGFLESIAKSDDPYFADCPYDLVTGSSTGAIIAPFAFLGTTRDLEKVSQIYREELPADNTVERRNLLGALKHSALFNTSELRNKVRKTLADDELKLVPRIAEEANKNRLLLVSAVNIDTGQIEIFNLTSIAANGDYDENEKIDLIAKAITASAAIPVAFDPIHIDGCMYQDAALRSNAFMSGELAALLVEKNGGTVENRDSIFGGNEFLFDLSNYAVDRTVGIDLIINGNPITKKWTGSSEYNLISVALRDVQILLNQSMLSSISRIRDTSGRLGWNVRYQDAVDFEEKSEASPLSASGSAFDRDFIIKLNNYGFELGQSLDRWKDIIGPGVPAEK